MLKINSFESMIHQFDQAKDTEELMILHQHFYKFLHENFLSHKDLGDAELTRMSEYFTATKLSLLIDRYRPVIGKLRRENRKLYDDIGTNGISSFKDYDDKILE